jgi:DNA-binding NtrC family response regulator
VVRQFPSTIKGELGRKTQVEISAVMKSSRERGFILLFIRDISRRVEPVDDAGMLLQFLREMSGQLGQASLKEIVSTAIGLVERYYIEVALEAAGGNRTAAARMLGVSRQGFYDKLARYGVDSRADED